MIPDQMNLGRNDTFPCWDYLACMDFAALSDALNAELCADLAPGRRPTEGAIPSNQNKES